jgi:hypothetical protein
LRGTTDDVEVGLGSSYVAMKQLQAELARETVLPEHMEAKVGKLLAVVTVADVREWQKEAPSAPLPSMARRQLSELQPLCPPVAWADRAQRDKTQRV